MKSKNNHYLFFVLLLSCTLGYSQIPILDPGFGGGGGLGDCESWEMADHYRDADGDGYGDRQDMIPLRLCANQTYSGYVTNNLDCDDNNNTLGIAQTWYYDNDEDGVGGSGGLSQRSCMQPGPNWSLTNNDCNDNLASVTGPRIWYADTDDDGKGDFLTPTSSPTCTPPLGYVDNADDCNDSDGDNFIYTWYRDYDQDGLGDPSISVTSCNPPNDNYWVLNADDSCPNYTGESDNQGCPVGDVGEEPWNTIKTTTYDVTELPIGKTKSYFDDLGKPVQNLTLDFKTNTTWATQTLYDSQGRPALQTLGAPAYGEETFLYKEGFIKKSNGEQYDMADFETDPENPQPVGEQGLSLGWYYSGNNTNEAYQDITDYPFSRTVYSKLNPGKALRVLGGNKTGGKWKNGYSFTMKAGAELAQQGAFGDPSYNTSQGMKILKTVSRDVHGEESVVFTDTDGRTLAAARSGLGTIRNTTVVIGEQGFVDIHVPQNITGFTVNKGPGVQIRVFDLITEEQVTISTTSLPNGFYRVEASNVGTGTVSVTYKENYYDYSLNYYDKIGRLTKSTQPLDRLETTYTYDTMGQLISTTSPDEGTSNFKYREDGQIRYSQNSKQAAVNQFSYTNYDLLGRPVESGVINSSRFATADPDTTALPSGSKIEVQATVYDQLPAGELAGIGAHVDYRNPTFLDGNVAKSSNDHTTTYYSYDVYGRVKWILQNIPGLGLKTIDYTYDDITGSVNMVDYQKHQPSERFIHRYSYHPIDYSLTRVETSTDGVNFTEHALYDYYETGALKRTEIGGGLQGIDYVYNLNGQLKSINHPGLNSTSDPGGDSNDFFGMSIDYNSSDYLRSGSFSSQLGSSGAEQFNGNIKGIAWNTATGNRPMARYGYRYNRNNWLESATYNSAGAAATDYKVDNLTYDANGNIQSLRRNKNTVSGSNVMDNLTYSYKTGKPNQLDRVADAAGNRGVGDLASQPVNNYNYNSIGQLTKNLQDKIGYVYNASGLVTQITNLITNLPAVTFGYDDRGHRLWKTKHFQNGVAQTRTWYVRDASGSPMAIYVDGTPKEYPIYGSGRVGIYRKADASSHYQLTDHLGNVRAVVRRSPTSVAANDTQDFEYDTEGWGEGPPVVSVSNDGGRLNLTITNRWNYSAHDFDIDPSKPFTVSFDFDRGNQEATYMMIWEYKNGSLEPWQERTYTLLDRDGRFEVTHQPTAGSDNRVHITFEKSGSIDNGQPTTVYIDNFSLKQDLDAAITSATDYYPFGMAMPNTDNIIGDYRYAYQGQERDPETGKEAFEARLWDSRIGRWLTTDPAGEFFSPYLGMGNNPISMIDPDGRCIKCPNPEGVEVGTTHTENGYTFTMNNQGVWWSESYFNDNGITVIGDSRSQNYTGEISLFGGIGSDILQNSMKDLTKSDFLIGRIDPKYNINFSNSTPSSAMGNVYKSGYKDLILKRSNLKLGIKVGGVAFAALDFYSTADNAAKGNYAEAAAEGTKASLSLASNAIPILGPIVFEGAYYLGGNYLVKQEWYNRALFGVHSKTYYDRGMRHGFGRAHNVTQMLLSK
ncbi:RHS repeat-associated core domain-containing protein [Nonlabens agnitus]|nr:RHS repeat-associated core domain-containing protein [Nonlabens agnitus]